MIMRYLDPYSRYFWEQVFPSSATQARFHRSIPLIFQDIPERCYTPKPESTKPTRHLYSLDPEGPKPEAPHVVMICVSSFEL